MSESRGFLSMLTHPSTVCLSLLEKLAKRKASDVPSWTGSDVSYGSGTVLAHVVSGSCHIWKWAMQSLSEFLGHSANQVTVSPLYPFVILTEQQYSVILMVLAAILATTGWWSAKFIVFGLAVACIGNFIAILTAGSVLQVLHLTSQKEQILYTLAYKCLLICVFFVLGMRLRRILLKVIGCMVGVFTYLALWAHTPAAGFFSGYRHGVQDVFGAWLAKLSHFPDGSHVHPPSFFDAMSHGLDSLSLPTLLLQTIVVGALSSWFFVRKEWLVQLVLSSYLSTKILRSLFTISDNMSKALFVTSLFVQMYTLSAVTRRQRRRRVSPTRTNKSFADPTTSTSAHSSARQASYRDASKA